MQKKKVFAFVLDLNKSLFRKHISDQDLNAIRIISEAPDADLMVIYPGEWKPPKVNSFSAEEINSKMKEINARAHLWLHNHLAFLEINVRNINKVVFSKDGKKAFVIFLLG